VVVGSDVLRNDNWVAAVFRRHQRGIDRKSKLQNKQSKQYFLRIQGFSEKSVHNKSGEQVAMDRVVQDAEPKDRTLHKNR
jgi:hypothetical protein